MQHVNIVAVIGFVSLQRWCNTRLLSSKRRSFVPSPSGSLRAWHKPPPDLRRLGFAHCQRQSHETT
ncbi:hypothetical protein [Scytonema sp. HK-05]|uniref:hypothetical protein n=1 Tax=Scytonema sp. HK-05 TaxID=1137095 RepID=UPI0011611CAD|nr:hypothetical protein [Scytonema sp. HK-05]